MKPSGTRFVCNIYILLKLSAKRLYRVCFFYYFRKIICALFQMKYSILGKICLWSKEILGSVTLKLKRVSNRTWIKMFMFSNPSLPHGSYVLSHRYCSFCNYTINEFWNNTLFWYPSCIINNFFPSAQKKSRIETELNFSSSLMFKLPNIMRKSLNHRNLIPNIVTVFFFRTGENVVLLHISSLAKIGLVATTLFFFELHQILVLGETQFFYSNSWECGVKEAGQLLLSVVLWKNRSLSRDMVGNAHRFW